MQWFWAGGPGSGKFYRYELSDRISVPQLYGSHRSSGNVLKQQSIRSQTRVETCLVLHTLEKELQHETDEAVWKKCKIVVYLIMSAAT
ncbi:hypothetical protein TNCT_191751 [Trichonephila clavata]|uniref:Uncharacterized protein n=1 Tax=Trichonephila clavata TaxID=2740835 RepID=A0A8X6HNE4_TRICU|nr:hypothetical protein TNCT_191751 [Trichonephila clavata]